MTDFEINHARFMIGCNANGQRPSDWDDWAKDALLSLLAELDRCKGNEDELAEIKAALAEANGTINTAREAAELLPGGADVRDALGMPEYVPVEAAAGMLRMGVAAITQLVREGKLKQSSAGNSLRICRESMIAWRQKEDGE